jgi:hypothetical protein
LVLFALDFLNELIEGVLLLLSVLLEQKELQQEKLEGVIEIEVIINLSPPTIFLYLPPELGPHQLVLQEQLHIIKAQFLRVAAQHIIDKLISFMTL